MSTGVIFCHAVLDKRDSDENNDGIKGLDAIALDMSLEQVLILIVTGVYLDRTVRIWHWINDADDDNGALNDLPTLPFPVDDTSGTNIELFAALAMIRRFCWWQDIETVSFRLFTRVSTMV